MIIHNKRIWSSILLLMVILMLFVRPSSSKEDLYTTNKIKLGHYKFQSGKPVRGSNGVQWWNIENTHVAVDELLRIYILDIYKQRVLVFSPDGALLKVVVLKDATFPFIDRDMQDGYMQYMIQVSADGSFIYVTSGSEEYSWAIYNNAGNTVRRNVHRDVLFERRCHDDKFIGFYAGFDMLDVRLNVIKRIKSDVVQGELYDMAGNTYAMDRTLLLRNPVVKKVDSAGKKIWVRKIKDNKYAIKMLGIDGSGNIYVLMGEPYEIVKIDAAGQLIGRITLPANIVGGADKILRAGRFLVLCNGTIYFVPPVSLIDKQYKDKLTKVDDYTIHRFDVRK